ncbi:MAG: hypothetical protein E7576_00835 [Ruminococcaceae bacterium]|nr:hypothetical protein [Oscillospiraceae bacterium]
MNRSVIRTLAALLSVTCLSLTAGCSSTASEDSPLYGSASAGVPEAETETREFPFADVSPSDWFYSDVKTAWESGLIRGKTDSAFAPDDSLTYAEAVKLAACMNQLYVAGEVTLTGGEGAEWFEPYVLYCSSAGILPRDYNWNSPAYRVGIMEIFASALPEGALAAVNDIPDGAVPDLAGVNESESDAVYRLYRAGVVQGSGTDHLCAPFSPVRRSEVSAMLTRLMFPDTRISFAMNPSNPSPASGSHVIETIGGVTYVDGILIANKTYSLPRDYAPGGLTADCQAALDAMCAGAASDGIVLYPISTYRSYDYQEGLYNRYVERDGKAEADRYSARPGHSEHQTGLAIDLNSLEYAFADTPEGRWIAAHCHEYGFILRYPEGKEDVTGYRYEPWHVRYLGIATASAVAASGLTLEEYLGITSEYAD